MESSQYDAVAALDAAASSRREGGRSTVLDEEGRPPLDVDDYFRQREELAAREGSLAFDHLCQTSAAPWEVEADRAVRAVRRRDEAKVYGKAPPRLGHGGQQHRRFMGDHFLSNVALIEQTALYRIAQAMPKGAHLHIHFNANLQPHVLLDIAKRMDRMFVTSDVPLVDADAFGRCKMRFSILSADKERPGDLFSADYAERGTMRFQDFCEQFPRHYGRPVDAWLREKLVFGEEEAHHCLQTAEGAWEKFNTRTQMMKGLFNYETAYREYTRQCLQEFVDDNIQYAEIRPNFMKANQLWTDDGTRLIDNAGIMEMIIDECGRFRQNCSDKAFHGIKVIYCTPRSFSRDEVTYALDECLAFKKRWPGWIAGFDLVGEEAQGHPLKYFARELLDFQKRCAADSVDIPFLFHCGETLGVGGEADGNLLDALLLGAKRVGHGFALPRHPYVLEQMKRRGVCVELCPISNEILGLTARVGGHAMYGLLASNVHCTVSADNGTLFRSRLSHDFYQVMAGKEDMGLAGWRQLVEWSIEHACMEGELREAVTEEWKRRWEGFCRWISEEYGDLEG